MHIHSLLCHNSDLLVVIVDNIDFVCHQRCYIYRLTVNSFRNELAGDRLGFE